MFNWREEKLKSVGINQLYSFAKFTQVTLFPNSQYDFWAPYNTNSAAIDRYFAELFKAFKLINLYPATASTDDMLEDFKSIVESFFFINSKRYNELYRVQVLAADAYDIVNNYDLREESTRTNTGTQETVYGQRIDSQQYGQRIDSQQYGQKQTTNLYGAKDETTVHGAREDTNDTTLGEQSSGSTQTRSAFNSADLVDVSGGSIENGAREDSSTLNVGEQTDTYTTEAHTDTVTEGQHTDQLTKGIENDQLTKGSETDTRTDDLSEGVELHRYGNIGVQTPADIIGGHIKLWEAFKFYEMIFDEFAEKFLTLDTDFYIGGVYGYNFI